MPGTAEAAFILTARDRASGQFAKVSASALTLGTRLKLLLGTIGMLIPQFNKITTAIGLFSLALAAIPLLAGIVMTKKIIDGIIEFGLATRRARLQMELMGINAESAKNQVRALAGVIDRATMVSLTTSAKAVEAWVLAGYPLTKQLATMAEELYKLTGIPVEDIFAELVTARITDNVSGFLKLLGDTNILVGVDLPKNFTELKVKLEEFLSKENLDSASALADSFRRLSEVTLPTREKIAEMISSFINILIETLAEKLEAQKDKMEELLWAALAAVFLAPKGLAWRLGAGFAVAFGGALLLDLGNTIVKAFEDPVTVGVIVAAAYLLGSSAGSKWLAGFIAFLALNFGPQLIEELRRAGIDPGLLAVAIALGTVLGRMLRLGIIQGLVLGSILYDIFNELFSEKEIAHGLLRVAVAGLGAAIGFLIGGGLGAVLGAFIGNELYSFLLKAGWVDKALKSMESLGKAIGEGVVAGFKYVFRGLINWIVDFINWFRTQINKILGIFGQSLPLMERWEEPIPLPRTPPGTPEFQRGGWVPGTPGQATPIIAHGGEYVMPRGGAPITIQLIIDKRVVNEWVVDAVSRVARLKAGLTPSSLGS